jgi:ketosteroid isomerase-like protein
VIEDGDNVVALVHLFARGKTSGVPVDIRFYAEHEVRDGKVVHIFDHPERTAALEAAGLSE